MFKQLTQCRCPVWPTGGLLSLAALWSTCVSWWRAGFREHLYAPQRGIEEPANRSSSLTVEYSGEHKGWEEAERNKQENEEDVLLFGMWGPGWPRRTYRYPVLLNQALRLHGNVQNPIWSEGWNLVLPVSLLPPWTFSPPFYIGCISGFCVRFC